MKCCSQRNEIHIKHTEIHIIKRESSQKRIHLQKNVYECAEGVPKTADESIHSKICTILYIAYQFKQKSFA